MYSYTIHYYCTSIWIAWIYCTVHTRTAHACNLEGKLEKLGNMHFNASWKVTIITNLIDIKNYPSLFNSDFKINTCI